MSKSNIIKYRLTQKDNGKYTIVPFRNRQVSLGVLGRLSEAVREAILQINGDAYWKQYYIHFEHDGVRYKQVNSDNRSICMGCVFRDIDKGCQHPHYNDGTKGSCTGRIYVKE